ncbi:MAG: metallophosphoesterase [Lachnospiraceae bacterium]
MALYACSDMHGQYGLFKQMLEDIHFSMEDSLFILGDVIDRGPASIPMLLDIMKRPNVFCIMGNHELMMYTHYKYPHRNDAWFLGANGGKKTKGEFERLGEPKREEVLSFIGDMYMQIDLTVEDMHFLLSHSDFLPEERNVKFGDVDYDTAFNLVWRSPWRMYEYVPETKYAEDGRVHVIGHVPTQRILGRSAEPQAYVDSENFIINIDLGCASLAFGDATGCLCCLNLTKLAQGEGREAFRYYR